MTEISAPSLANAMATARPMLHFMFPARLLLLVLRRLKFLFFGHKTYARGRDSRNHLSDGAFGYALLSSRQPSATVQSVASPRASRVSITLALTLTDDSRA